MRLCTMTSMFREQTDAPGFITCAESVRRIHRCGYDSADLNMCAMLRGETEFNDDESWEANARELRKTADSLGIEFYSCHPPFPKPATRRKSVFDDGGEQSEFFVKMMYRSLDIAGICGVRWAVFHPVADDMNTAMLPGLNIEYNHFIYDKFIKYASERGVGAVFENMADVDNKRRFGATPFELCELVDSFGNVGVCWDFGHGNRMLASQIEAIRYVGKRLRVTHVDDNIGETDLHTLPLLGTTKWSELMPVLAEIGFEGDFNYEVKLNNKIPDFLKDEAATFAAKIGRYLISLAQ